MRATMIVVAGIGLSGCAADPAGYTGQAYVSGPVSGAQYAAPAYGYGSYGGAESGPGFGYATPGYGYAAPGYVQPYATAPVLVPQAGIGIGSYGGGFYERDRFQRDRFQRERLERERFREQFERQRVQGDRFNQERSERDRRERTGQGRPDIRPYAGPPLRTVPVAQPAPPRPAVPRQEQREQRDRPHMPWDRR